VVEYKEKKPLRLCAWSTLSYASKKQLHMWFWHKAGYKVLSVIDLSHSRRVFGILKASE